MTEQLTAADVLERAADKLDEPGAWTQGKFARGKSGKEVDMYGRAATCWCAMGAVRAVSDKAWSGNAWKLDLIVEKTLPDQFRHGDGLAAWNDRPERTQAEVVKALREAAALARAEAA